MRTEKADWHNASPHYRGRQAELRLTHALVAGHQPIIVALPQWIARYGNQLPDKDTKERQADLGQREVVVVSKDEREGAEEEVQDSQEQCRKQAEVETLCKIPQVSASDRQMNYNTLMAMVR